MLSKLNEDFTLKNLGKLDFFLGVEVMRIDEEFHISQHKCILELLEKNSAWKCKANLHTYAFW